MSENPFKQMCNAVEDFMRGIKELKPLFDFMTKNPRQKVAWDCYDVIWYKARKHQIKRLAQGWRLGLFE